MPPRTPQSDSAAFYEQFRKDPDSKKDNIKPIDGLGRLIPQDKVIDYLLAGKAIITVKSLGERKPNMPERVTYKIACKRGDKPEEADIWFINVLTGANNNSDYTYLGYIKYMRSSNLIEYRRDGKSRIGVDAPSHIIWDHVFKLFAQRRVHDKLEVWHEGRCVRCGLRLTDPDSIARGMGSHCAGVTKIWRPLEVVANIKKGTMADYNKVLANRTDVTLTPEQEDRAQKLTKANKLLERNKG